MFDRSKFKGIIFDMDNTLLHSKIDFKSMKQDIFDLLVQKGLLPDDFPTSSHTASTIMEEVKHSPFMSSELHRHMWDIASYYELKGMEGAELETGAKSMLEKIFGKYCLVILTNNSYASAAAALKNTGIIHYFEHVIGREQVTALKPLPAGVQHILALYGGTNHCDWISVGDSWTDGKAAQEAGVRFIAYQGNLRTMEEHNVYPAISIEHMDELIECLTTSEL